MNEKRTARGRVALRAYAKETRMGMPNKRHPQSGDGDTVLADLLTDLRHYCDYMGYDFEYQVERSGRRHQEEVRRPND